MIPQQLLAAKSQQLQQIVNEILTVVSDAVQHQTPIHQVESKIFQTLLRGGRIAVQSLVDCLGDGDVGQEQQLADGTTLHRSAQPQPRPYVSIFGELDIKQYVYAEREGQAIRFAAIAARLALPESKFSYLLQDWDQNFAMEQPFRGVSQTVERILGLDQHVDSVERMNREMAQAAGGFHLSRTAPP